MIDDVEVEWGPLLMEVSAVVFFAFAAFVLFGRDAAVALASVYVGIAILANVWRNYD